MIRGLLFLATAIPSFAQERMSFTALQAGEVIAELRLSSPSSDWAIRGREAAVAAVRVDNRPVQHVIVYGGPKETTYRVALGVLAPGEHELIIDRDPKHSAQGSQLSFVGATFQESGEGHSDHAIYANAPILTMRKNTIGRFSDIPLLMYCERLNENGQGVLQYTVVFSNEDGGTSTRALMARWGRTTDIEYIYRAYLDNSGKVVRSTVQGRDHKELEYAGKREDSHPLLMPVTDNNMVDEAADLPLRFQLAPRIVSLETYSREQIMDEFPAAYLVSAKELQREAKLRPFGDQAGEKISDPRNYVYFEYKATHTNSALAVAIQLKDGRAFSSDLGRLDYTITRDGWVRTAVELPPNTTPLNIAGVELRCMVAPPEKNQSFAHSGRCQVDRVNKAFFLDLEYKPRPPFWKMETPVLLPSGQSATFRL